MKQQKQQRITAVVGDGFYTAIIAVCNEKGMTPSELVRNAIIAYVQTQWNITLTDDTRKQGYQWDVTLTDDTRKKGYQR